MSQSKWYFSLPHTQGSTSRVSKQKPTGQNKTTTYFCKKHCVLEHGEGVQNMSLQHKKFWAEGIWEPTDTGRGLLCTPLICLKAGLPKELHCHKSLLREASHTRGKERLLPPEMRSQRQDEKLHTQTLLNQTLPSISFPHVFLSHIPPFIVPWNLCIK